MLATGVRAGGRLPRRRQGLCSVRRCIPMSPVPLPQVVVEPLVRAALLEDLGRAGDITTDAIAPPDLTARVALTARQPGVVAGLDLALLAFRLVEPRIAAEVERP